MAAHKREGPSTSLSVLGIVIDTIASKLCLPADKLEHLQTLLGQKSMLLQGVGIPHRPSQSRMQSRQVRKILLSKDDRPPPRSATPSTVYLPQCQISRRSSMVGYLSEIMEWHFFPPPSLLPKTIFTTDASGLCSCGAWCSHAWFQLHWDTRAQPLSIAEKELKSLSS